MFSVKKNVLQTVALVKAYNIRHIVVSPGSRNAPLIHTFSQDNFFTCHTVVDERNAAFYALGIIQALHEPVAVCCTSGTALLNYAPAVAEAFYQQLPLVVLSADRTPEWIGQMDGQTLPQAGVFGKLVKHSVQLPEVKSEADEWLCNRLCNEALITCTADAWGPVHINIPLAEPLFDYSQAELPEVRRIHFTQNKKEIDVHPFVEKWNSKTKRMIIVGQRLESDELTMLLNQLQDKADCVVLTEHLSNCQSDSFVTNFDALLFTLSEEQQSEFTPDLVITVGGHIVSKRLKHFLRKNKPQSHWHLSESGELIDLFQSLTDIIESETESFFSQLNAGIQNNANKPFFTIWKNASKHISEPDAEIPFSDISVTGTFLKALSKEKDGILHLANSSIVRNAQLFSLEPSINVLCNRGTNGIEGTVPSTIGTASVYNGLVYMLVGDLSFFYGLSALWNIESVKNLRIVLINNRGGGIFHLLPTLNTSLSLEKYVVAEHNTDAKRWALAAGLHYLSANNKEELNNQLDVLFESGDKSILLEVFTDAETNKAVNTAYYKQLKKNEINK